ncbi:hypothetical protein BKA67DRAFT_299794 [Truncatella angustata]|uniref:Uncharacterized protein n=1 Tax=Truncatella angustata TaxID=152316 RepID=A0A9P8UIE3_9PEZI|nr:uncharacterized protein BKA67DRAFT_299794 [Truncatella angustata]KAH6652717.1 hypothetical protein BKA67DRAFT_299794 [Truncatella angustata]
METTEKTVDVVDTKPSAEEATAVDVAPEPEATSAIEVATPEDKTDIVDVVDASPSVEVVPEPEVSTEGQAREEQAVEPPKDKSVPSIPKDDNFLEAEEAKDKVGPMGTGGKARKGKQQFKLGALKVASPDVMALEFGGSRPERILEEEAPRNDIAGRNMDRDETWEDEMIATDSIQPDAVVDQEPEPFDEESSTVPLDIVQQPASLNPSVNTDPSGNPIQEISGMAGSMLKPLIFTQPDSKPDSNNSVLALEDYHASEVGSDTTPIAAISHSKYSFDNGEKMDTSNTTKTVSSVDKSEIGRDHSQADDTVVATHSSEICEPKDQPESVGQHSSSRGEQKQRILMPDEGSTLGQHANKKEDTMAASVDLPMIAKPFEGQISESSQVLKLLSSETTYPSSHGDDKVVDDSPVKDEKPHEPIDDFAEGQKRSLRYHTNNGPQQSALGHSVSIDNSPLQKDALTTDGGDETSHDYMAVDQLVQEQKISGDSTPVEQHESALGEQPTVNQSDSAQAPDSPTVEPEILPLELLHRKQDKSTAIEDPATPYTQDEVAGTMLMQESAAGADHVPVPVEGFGQSLDAEHIPAQQSLATDDHNQRSHEEQFETGDEPNIELTLLSTGSEEHISLIEKPGPANSDDDFVVVEKSGDLSQDVSNLFGDKDVPSDIVLPAHSTQNSSLHDPTSNYGTSVAKLQQPVPTMDLASAEVGHRATVKGGSANREADAELGAYLSERRSFHQIAVLNPEAESREVSPESLIVGAKPSGTDDKNFSTATERRGSASQQQLLEISNEEFEPSNLKGEDFDSHSGLVIGVAAGAATIATGAGVLTHKLSSLRTADPKNGHLETKNEVMRNNPSNVHETYRAKVDVTATPDVAPDVPPKSPERALSPEPLIREGSLEVGESATTGESVFPEPSFGSADTIEASIMNRTRKDYQRFRYQTNFGPFWHSNRRRLRV